MENYMTKFLLTKNGLNILHAKCEIFKNMIKEKNPSRSDLIESFEYSKSECIEAMLFIEELDREFRALRQRASDLELSCMILTKENVQLRSNNNQLIDRVEI